ncbi:MAG TPA: family 20 glycosylhydrolase, partial [Candidatus Limnocylindria bacterium]|nr:family 20 glycosylhydrolase [Candidatus Limnocylindria bacterium]
MPPTSIIPIPAKLTPRSGSFALDAATSIVAGNDLRSQAELLRDQLRLATGLPLSVTSSGSGSRITLALDPSLGGLGDEGYRLTVTADEVAMRAPKSAGILHASQTLRQLLPPAIFRRAPVPGGSWAISAVEIEDRPRFGWRGSHLDVGRHFMPKEFVLKHIDLLALHKFNVFHWHLTEDQGWRIEIKKYPKLTSVGAFRKDSMTAPRTKDPALRKFSGRPHGGFYTQDDVREVVRY